MSYTPYIIVILLAYSKRVTAKSCEIKNEKSTTLSRLLTAVDPAKRDAKQARFGLAMLDFRTEHCQLTACA